MSQKNSNNQDMDSLPQEIQSEVIAIQNDTTFYKDHRLNLQRLGDHYNLKIKEVDFKEETLSGALVKDSEDDFIIYVNNSDSDHRKRFTIAHEIGHFISYKKAGLTKPILDRDNTIEDHCVYVGRTADGSDNDQKAEIEANSIAAELLMPETKVRDLVQDKFTVDALAKKFDVSRASMSVRLSKLGYEFAR